MRATRSRGRIARSLPLFLPLGLIIAALATAAPAEACTAKGAVTVQTIVIVGDDNDVCSGGCSAKGALAVSAGVAAGEDNRFCGQRCDLQADAAAGGEAKGTCVIPPDQQGAYA